ncbi:UPF0598 protein [Pseudolycoriella hygida]|uniref:UPF0598 protein n=1 Tax=Pseudolycoriella hygida TaxID=35572 RepID=A0A9Q0RV30_9DIPT|nr:UPF0598 protein [Pseudolycoriella hygida]
MSNDSEESASFGRNKQKQNKILLLNIRDINAEMIYTQEVMRKCFQLNRKLFSRSVSYMQGQLHDNKTREYFYYIDHNGMLFLDDAKMKNFTSCFKDKKFLQFFFNRLRLNDTNRFQIDFPYLSVCGRERNYIRCDDLPIVFTHVVVTSEEQIEKLSYAHAGELLTLPFEPNKIFMSPTSGRVYHPADTKHGSIGLIRSKLAIEFSKHFEFENDEEAPTHFTWNGVRYKLDNSWMVTLQTLRT